MLYLLKVSFTCINLSIPGNAHLFGKTIKKLLPDLQQISKYVNILISRHGWHYRKEWLQCINTSIRSSIPVPLPARYELFNYYEDSASVGRFPHIFWQEIALSQKIIHHDLLEVIFYTGNEENCCVCLKDEKHFQDNFCHFLKLRSDVCVSCAEFLLVDDFKTR